MCNFGVLYNDSVHLILGLYTLVTGLRSVFVNVCLFETPQIVMALVSFPLHLFKGLVWLCGHRSGDYCKYCNL